MNPNQVFSHPMRKPLSKLGSILAIALILCGIQARDQGRTGRTGERGIPAAEFARICRDFSEEGGYFRSDNFVSNETSYLHIVDKLKELGVSGGAFIGVGPEQNFTYIAKIRPRIAFIVDIRRQAVIQQLMFKAIFHYAETRAKFLSVLFCRPIIGKRAPGADASATELVDYFAETPADHSAFARNVAMIRNTIVRDFHIPMEAQDQASLEYIYSAFRDENVNLQYRSFGFGYRSGGYGYRPRGFGAANSWGYFPKLQDLILATDLRGRQGNFLASRRDYEFVRSLQEDNRIIPLVGDFGGTRALASVAEYLKSNGYTVSAFYTSNVEQYLFGSRGFDAFARNVAKLPITEKSLFIRAYPNQRAPHPAQVGNHRLTTLLQKISVFNADYRNGLYTDYWTMVRTHYIGAQAP